MVVMIRRTASCPWLAERLESRLLYDQSAYESDCQLLPLAPGQRYRDYLMREYGGERCRVWRPPDRHSGSFASEAIS